MFISLSSTLLLRIFNHANLQIRRRQDAEKQAEIDRTPGTRERPEPGRAHRGLFTRIPHR